VIVFVFIVKFDYSIQWSVYSIMVFDYSKRWSVLFCW